MKRTEAEILGIDLLHAFGYRQPEIADVFGITPRIVEYILHEKRRAPAKITQSGGLVTSGGNQMLEARDLAEVHAYLAANPGAKIWEVAMCCNMGNKEARRLCQSVRE